MASRALGGNFLPNVGPDGNGDMHPNFYPALDSLSAWMKHSGESLLGAGPSPGEGYSNVPLTTRGNKRVSVIYAHLLPSFQGQVSVLTCRKPKKVILLRTGEDIPFFYCGGSIQFKVSPSCRTKTDDVVKITI